MKFTEILKKIDESIGRCYFVVAFDLESGLPISGFSRQYQDSLESITAANKQMIDIVLKGQQQARLPVIRAALKNFKELILETSKSTFVILLPRPDKKIAVAVGVPKDVQLGWVKYSIQRHYDELVDALQEL
ncbi:MAG: hypothetical protein DRQ10_02560 [Candidatus Hydrothermota bacterium]|nr:MAG: hypothetical protein DRQ10_02560 [Candidatus Hydrothermae bacterium]